MRPTNLILESDLITHFMLEVRDEGIAQWHMEDPGWNPQCLPKIKEEDMEKKGKKQLTHKLAHNSSKRI